MDKISRTAGDPRQFRVIDLLALAAMRFIPWQRVDVRPSQYFTDRLVVVIRPEVGSPVASTRLAQVPGAVGERILALARQRAGDGAAVMR
jgi:hypothetical protein